ncbi:MAG: HlyD family efflux transporter periplasmic adaptor subunit [Bacteroidota bacterium]
MNRESKLWLSIIIGAMILGGGYFGMTYLSSQKKPPPVREEVNRRKEVSTTSVTNTTVPTTLEIQGRLQAFNKIALFSEVTGTLEATGRPFKVGTYFPKGAPMLTIDDDETQLNLQAQKATLLNSIAMMMPDIKIDYPNSFPQWEAYLNAFNVDSPIQALPEPKDQAEKLFVAGRNLYTQFYNIKSAEERLTKFTIFAPFGGVLTQASIDRVAVVRAGQQVGELMATGSYELVATVPLSQLNYLKTGNTVDLTSEDIPGKWSGKIKRISDQIDANSQTVEVFVGVSGKELREGMYLRGEAVAKPIAGATEIDRNLLIDQRAVYVLEADSIMRLQPVRVEKFNRETVIVSGLTDGTKMITNTVAGAFDGMLVKPHSATSNTASIAAPANL